MLRHNYHEFLCSDNCTCAGVANEWGAGKECNIYSGYDDEFLDGKLWCYAETTICNDTTNTKGWELKEGRLGPSQMACMKNIGEQN